MVSKILPLIPKHKLYCEPFFGGGAIFWAKEPSDVEVINDKDERVINFYRVCKDNFHILKYLVDRTAASRAIHEESGLVLNNPEKYGEVYRAWAFWMQTNMSFASAINAGFAYARKKNSCEKKLKNKKLAFTEELRDRLDLVQIECNDAIKVIQSRDSVDSFHYVDPPYFNAVMGHYGGYTKDNFEDLLKCLSEVKGKFLLSSYDSDILKEYTKKHKWRRIEYDLPISAAKEDKQRRKIEVLTANYQIKKLE